MTEAMIPQPYRILQVVHETGAEYTFRVAYDGATGFGQFFMLSIPKVGEAPISVSARSPQWVEFTIRKVGRLTGRLFGLGAGDVLFMRGPYGNTFPMEEFAGRDLVVIAGGTGLAPLRAMLHHYEQDPGELRSLTLLAGFKDRASVLFEEDLERFRSAFATVYTLDNEDAPGFRKGFVTAYIRDVPFAAFDDYRVVVVGPPVMMHRAAEECIRNGAAADRIFVSFERKMSCALGKCGHCKINETYVCVEGPVFRYARARDMFD